jgi:ATP-binding protein involved in chromosome partitioning
MPLPLEIVGIGRPTVTLVWEDEHRSEYSARDLRLACRCALCIEEMTGAPLLDPAKVPPDVVARGIELVGQYAMSVRWSDGHATGIYNFRDLRENCPCEACAQRRVTGVT